MATDTNNLYPSAVAIARKLGYCSPGILNARLYTSWSNCKAMVHRMIAEGILEKNQLRGRPGIHRVTTENAKNTEEKTNAN